MKMGNSKIMFVTSFLMMNVLIVNSEEEMMDFFKSESTRKKDEEAARKQQEAARNRKIRDELNRCIASEQEQCYKIEDEDQHREILRKTDCAHMWARPCCECRIKRKYGWQGAEDACAKVPKQCQMTGMGFCADICVEPTGWLGGWYQYGQYYQRVLDTIDEERVIESTNEERMLDVIDEERVEKQTVNTEGPSRKRRGL